MSGHGKSVATVSSEGATAGMAVKSKINTAEGIQESECTHSSLSSTTNTLSRMRTAAAAEESHTDTLETQETDYSQHSSKIITTNQVF